MAKKKDILKVACYICLPVLVFSLMFIAGCGGGDDGDDGASNTTPTCTITSPSDDSSYTKGDIITFTGSGSDDEDGILTGSSLIWTSDIEGQIGTGTSFSIDSLSAAGTHTITLTATDSGNASDADSIDIIVALLYDDFEEADCLNKWTIGGRQAEGTNTADCEMRNGSNKGHLFKYSFTEITLTPALGAFEFSENLNFDFEMEVRVSSSGEGGSEYYGMSGVDFSFYDSEDNVLGSVSYIAATTQYPFDIVATEPTKAAVEIAEDVNTYHSLSVEEILSYIDIDEALIATVTMTFKTYSSTRPLPYVEAELWIDNVIVSDFSQ